MCNLDWSPTDERMLLSPRSRGLPDNAPRQPTTMTICDNFAMQQLPSQQLSLLDEETESTPSTEVSSLDPFVDLLSCWNDEPLLEGGAVSLVVLNGMCAGSSAHCATSVSKPLSSPCAAPREQVSARRSGSRRGNSSRQRAGHCHVSRKDEIHHLREEIPKLEARLRDLIEHWKRRAVNFEHWTSRPTTLSVADNSVQRWKEITSRHREQLSGAEEERERLRSQLQTQKKLTRAIQKLLAVRAASVARLRQELRRHTQVDPRHIVSGYSSDLERVVATTNAMSSDIRRVYEIIASRTRGCASFRAWAVQQESDNSVFAELAQSYEVPFDKAHVCRTLQPFLCSARKDSVLHEYSGEVKNLSVRQFVVGIGEHGSSAFVRIKEALNCIHTEAFFVYVISRVIDRTGITGTSINVAQLVERWWIIVSDGNCDSSSDGTECPTTMIQSYYTMQQEESDDDNEGNALWNHQAIEQILIPNLDDDFATWDRGLETALLNAVLMKNKQRITEDSVAIIV